MNVVTGNLRRGVEALSARRWVFLGIVVLPILLTFVIFPIHSVLTNTPRDAYGLPMAYLIYGIANIVVVGGLYALLAPAERRAIFRFRQPSRSEIAWAVGLFPVGLGVFLATDTILSQFGFAMTGLGYSLSNPVTFVTVLLGAVIIAPISEEILYRGLVLGKLLSHGVGAATAVAVMALLFGLIHLPNFGVTGTVFTTIWGILPAILRLRFDNLSGAVLLHMTNNVYAYLIVVALNLY